MRVARLTIDRFRAIKKAVLLFDGHTLLVGANNAGKSTICEALDLVLGPDRLSGLAPIEEYDFYNAAYLDNEGKPQTARVEVLLTGLSEEIADNCGSHIEYWHAAEKRLLGVDELEKVDGDDVLPCLRLETVCSYDPTEDEFSGETYYCRGTLHFDGSPERVHKRIKRMFGFLYLRTLRTGSRALSLERGSLLDIILRMQGARSGLWEQSIQRLRELDPPIASDASGLAQVLENIEKRIGQYISMPPAGGTNLYVSQLTREHLRKTISFFLSTNPDQAPVPFSEAGTGTLNTLVLALLSFIADVKPDNVIFAMEEPEIALPPHTQRRVANYLLGSTTQCFVTSHSPYVIERFTPEQVQVLKRASDGTITTKVASDGGIKGKQYRRHTRRGIAEAMLGRAVIVAEGLTEQAALTAAAEKMEDENDSNYPLDLSGVTIFPVDGDGSLPEFGTFFRALDLRTYAFFDKKPRKPEEDAKLKAAFDVPLETSYTAIETLLTTEVPVANQWAFLQQLKAGSELPNLLLPGAQPSDKEVRDFAYRALRSNKGNSFAARLIGLGTAAEIPATIRSFLADVYTQYPRPTAVPPLPKKEGAKA